MDAAAVASEGGNMSQDQRTKFRELHDEGCFIMPNPWDQGSARLLAYLGFPALATTSSGHAASLGRLDQNVTRDETLAHAADMAAAVAVPVNVDAERCFADDPAGVSETVAAIGRTGAAGCSIEDFDPKTGAIDPPATAVARVEAASAAARAAGLVLTARAENHIYGIADLDDTIARLCAYRDAGADVVYAPGLLALDDIARVVDETGIAVNVLALRDGPRIDELAAVGVRRVSTGGALARAAFGTLVDAARELLDHGTSTYVDRAIAADDLEAGLG